MDKFDQALMQVSTKLSNFGKTMKDKTDKPVASANKTFLGLSKTILGMIPGIGLFTAGYQAFTKVMQQGVQFAKESIAAYQAQEVANARLGAVIKATGADSWTSHRQLMDMAKEQAEATGHTYQEVQDMQSVLLGFTSITGEKFKEATDGLINMAAVMGGDLASAANQFGKALDTPAESLGTLSRYGFKFTEEQKKQVKQFEETGQHAKAQAIILDSMKSAFGNAGRAVNDAAKSQNDYNTEIQRLKINAGEPFEKAVKPVRDFFTEVMRKSNTAAEEQKKYNEMLKDLAKMEEIPNLIKSYEDRMRQTKGTDKFVDYTDQINTLKEVLESLGQTENTIKFSRLEYELKQATEQMQNFRNILLESTEFGAKLDVDIGKETRRIKNQTNVAKEVIDAELKDLAEERERKIDEYFSTGGLEEILNLKSNADENKQTLQYFMSQITRIKNEMNGLRGSVENETAAQRRNGKVTGESAALNASITKIQEEVKARKEALIKVETDYNEAIEETNRQNRAGIISEEDAEAQRASAAANRVKETAQLRDRYRVYNDIQNQLEAIQRIEDEAGGKDTEGKLAAMREELNKTQEGYNGLLRDTNSELNEATNLAKNYNAIAADRSLQEQTEEYTRQIQDLTASEYEAYEIEKERALLALHATDEYQRASDDKRRELEAELSLYHATKKRVEITDELEDKEQEYKDAAEDINREMENRQRLGESEIAWQLRKIENEKRWALEEFRASEIYKTALAEAARGNEEYINMINDVEKAIEDRAAAAKQAVTETSNISFVRKPEKRLRNAGEKAGNSGFLRDLSGLNY
jgi:hypothetical protein